MNGCVFVYVDFVQLERVLFTLDRPYILVVTFPRLMNANQELEIAEAGVMDLDICVFSA